MRIVVLCGNPRTAEEEPSSAATIAKDLGCEVVVARFDLGDINWVSIEEIPPSIVVFDAEDDLSSAMKSRRFLSSNAVLDEVPTLLITTLRRLSALDFSIGFDDFLLSPIIPAELYARIRKIDWQTADFGSDEVIKVGDLLIDVAGYEVRLGGRLIAFPHQEFELLRFLAHNRGRVYSREQLLQHLWEDDYKVGTRTVDIHIRRVRAKLGEIIGGRIVTVRGVGYKML